MAPKGKQHPPPAARKEPPAPARPAASPAPARPGASRRKRAGGFLRWPELLLTAVAATVALIAYSPGVRCELRQVYWSLTDAPFVPPAHPVHTAAYNSTLLWGTYRPHLYFGVRSRTPRGVLFGLAWRDREGRLPLRHTAEDGDEVHFGWRQHDGVSFGEQVITDRALGLRLTTTFVKRLPGPDELGGGDWTVRVEGASLGHARVRLTWYMAVEVAHADTRVVDRSNRTVLVVSREPLPFALLVHDAAGEAGTGAAAAAWRVSGANVSSNVWGVADRRLAEPAPADANALKFELDLPARGEVNVEFTLLSLEHRAGLPETVSAARAAAEEAGIVGCGFQRTLNARRLAFKNRFAETFPLQEYTAKEVAMAHTALSNYLGGLGYWHGSGLVKASGSPRPQRMAPVALFSGVPSRSKFPRGFLWDEGFHQLLLSRWDAELSKDVILHWLGTMDADGWVPREQILGAEARTRVPAEFVAQTPTHANPPTLALAIQNLARQNADGRHTAFLRRAWPLLGRWYRWFLRTQAAGAGGDGAQAPGAGGEAPDDALRDTFRWNGRSGPHCLPSGLDDYPRTNCPGGRERHLDLQSWVALLATLMRDIAEAVGEPAEEYGQRAQRVQAALLDGFWDAQRQQFSDPSGCVNAEERLRAGNEPPFLPHVGYVNLFPLLTGVLDPEDTERVGAVLRSARQLLSPHGLRSLREADVATVWNKESYWVGPIWVNINYLFLRALRTRYAAHPAAAGLYQQVREGLVRNIAREFRETRKLYENYNATSGRGQGTAPFTGWTILVVPIMAELY